MYNRYVSSIVFTEEPFVYLSVKFKCKKQSFFDSAYFLLIAEALIIKFYICYMTPSPTCESKLQDRKARMFYSY